MPQRRMTANDLTCQIRHGPVNVRNRRISPVAECPDLGPLTEPAADARPRGAGITLRAPKPLFPGCNADCRNIVIGLARLTTSDHRRPSGEPEKLASRLGPKKIIVLPVNEHRRGKHVRF
jgi:hypothetical protein